MFQMIAHGISSAGMFFMVGVVYDRVHHRDLDRFGGLFNKMPLYTGLSIAIFFAALGLPGRSHLHYRPEYGPIMSTKPAEQGVFRLLFLWFAVIIAALIRIER